MDQGTGGHRGAYSGGASLDTSGPIAGSGARAFDGSSGTVSYSGLSSLSGTFTLEGWVKLTGEPRAYATILAEANGVGLYVKTDVRQVCVDFGAGDHLSTGTVTLGQWAHIAVSVQGGNGTIYLNGQASGSFTGWTVTWWPNASGSGGHGSELLQGSLALLAIYPTALSAQRVQAHYQAAQAASYGYLGTALSDAPLGLWRLDEAEGALSAEDATGLGHTGSYVGPSSPSAGTARVTVPGVLASTVGSGFDGQTSYMTLSDPNNDLNHTTAVTVEAWVQVPGGSTERVILAKGRTSDGAGYALSVTAQHVLRFTSGSGPSLNLTGSTVIDSGGWRQVAATFDGTTCTLYVDGIAEQNTATGTLTSTSNPALIGRDGVGNELAGHVALVGV